MKVFAVFCVIALIMASLAVLDTDAKLKRAQAKATSSEIERIKLSNKADELESLRGDFAAFSKDSSNRVAGLQSKLRELARQLEASASFVKSNYVAGSHGIFELPAPIIEIDPRWKTKSVTFPKLYDGNGMLLAESAKYQHLNGLRLSFSTPTGVKDFNADDLHPDVLTYLSLDLEKINRLAQDRAIGAVAESKRREWAQEMRTRAAVEMETSSRAVKNQAEAEAARKNADANLDLAKSAREMLFRRQDVNVNVVNVPP